MSLNILQLGFNQDFTCFTCSTSLGFRVYGSEPLQEKFRREQDQGAIKIVQLLFRCNIIALVGGGANSKYPENRVVIWDDHTQRCIGELNFRSQVKAVRMKRDVIVVALEHKVYAYTFNNLKLISQFETQQNPKGLLEISQQNDTTIVASLGLHAGQIRIQNLESDQVQYLTAHVNKLQCMSLSSNGMLLATCSEKGTLVRVWDTESGQKLQEFRRGTEQAYIYNIAISQSCDYLALSSDKGTLHVFKLSQAVRDYFQQGGSSHQAMKNGDLQIRQSQDERFISNAQHSDVSLEEAPQQPSSRQNNVQKSSSVMEMFKGAMSWTGLTPEYSFAKVSVPIKVRCVVGFAPTPNTILALCRNGYVYQIKFDPTMKGRIYKQVKDQFLDVQQPSKQPFEDHTFLQQQLGGTSYAKESDNKLEAL